MTTFLLMVLHRRAKFLPMAGRHRQNLSESFFASFCSQKEVLPFP